MMHPRFGQINYEDAGQGAVLVLLHGFPFHSGIFQEQISILSQQFRVIAIDFPGAGSSALLSHPDMSMELLAEWVKAVLDQEHIAQVVLVGHSMGGYVAMAFAEQYAAMLKGLLLLHSTAYADSEEKKQARIRSIQFMETHGAKLFLKQMIPDLFSSSFKRVHSDQVERVVRESQQIPADQLIAYYKAMLKRPDRSYLLRNLKIPIAFVFGKEDTSILLEQALTQVSFPADSHVHILDQTGHISMLEQPKKLHLILSHFMYYCRAET